MSRTTLLILIAIWAAVLAIGVTVWLLRTRDVGGLSVFAPLDKMAQTQSKEKGPLYDPPSKFLPSSGKIEPSPPLPTTVNEQQVDLIPMIQLPSTMTP